MKKLSEPASLLSKVIREQKISQNTLIREAGIDRSSFYQILNGKRLGTLDQLTSILSRLDLSPKLEEQLATEHARRKFGGNFHLYEQVDSWMQKLSDADRDLMALRHMSPDEAEGTPQNGPKSDAPALDAAKRLRLMLCAEQEHADKDDLCLYIPLDLFSYLWMQTDVLKLLGDLARTRSVRILVAVNQGSDSARQEKGSFSAENSAQEPGSRYLVGRRLELLFSFLYGLAHVQHFADMVSISYVSHEVHDTPYPYFAVSGRQVCLLPEEGSGSLVLKQKKVVEKYSRFFDSLHSTSYEYLENYSSLENFMKSLYQRFAENSGKDRENRLAERSLCLFKVADSSQITRYADDSLREFLLSYKDMFSAMQSVFLNSASALQEFLSDRCVMENGFRIILDPEDVEKLSSQADMPDREDILLLTGTQDHLPRSWTIALFGSGELMILPNWDCRFIISIRSREMYHAFSVWFDVSRESALVHKRLHNRQYLSFNTFCTSN